MSTRTTLTVESGEMSMPMPDRSDVECRQSGRDWLLRLGRLHVWSEVEPYAVLQRRMTEAMTAGDYAHEMNILALIEHVKAGIAALIEAGYVSRADGVVLDLMLAGGAE